MATTAASLAARVPDLAALDSDLLTTIIAEATAEVAPENWATTARYDQAVLYLAAHKATLLRSAGGAAAGPLTSVSVGDVSTTFGTGSSSNSGADDLDLTSWGVAFRRLCGGETDIALPVAVY